MCKFIETESRIEVTRDWKGQGRGSYCFMVTEFFSVMMEKFWVQTVVMITPHCKCI